MALLPFPPREWKESINNPSYIKNYITVNKGEKEHCYRRKHKHKPEGIVNICKKHIFEQDSSSKQVDTYGTCKPKHKMLHPQHRSITAAAVMAVNAVVTPAKTFLQGALLMSMRMTRHILRLAQCGGVLLQRAMITVVQCHVNCSVLDTQNSVCYTPRTFWYATFCTATSFGSQPTFAK